MAGRDETAEIPLSLIGDYPNRWESSTLGRACSLVTDGTHDSPKETQTGFPLVTGRCITGGRINLKAAYFISEKDHKEVVARSKPEFGDILFANIGNSIGEMARVETNAEFSIKNVALFKPGPRLESRFLKYYLLSAPVQSFIRGNTFGSAQPFVGLGTLRAFPIPLPPLAEQKAIAAVLGVLDDKIELNRRMNATLEAMARALFQSWFVDFDPVRAKLDGRRPAGLDPATAALFPDHLEDSPLGHIPKGWKAGTVNDAFDFTMGQSPPGDTYNEEGNGLPFYQGRTDFGFRFPTRRVFCTAPTRYAKAGDTLVSVRAPVGDINIANEDCCIGRGVAAVRHKTGATSFTYHAMANLEPDFAKFEAEGTVFGSINKKNFENLRFVIPPPEIVAAYERQAAPLDQQIYNLEHQSRTLATLRDTLLPKLLSGVLSVLPSLEITEAIA